MKSINKAAAAAWGALLVAVVTALLGIWCDDDRWTATALVFIVAAFIASLAAS